MQYLPWRNRVVYRRIDNRWQSVINRVLTSSTKRIDDGAPEFRGMTMKDLGNLAPIVANRLESLVLRNFEGRLNLGRLLLERGYGSLREIRFGDSVLDFEQLAMFLDKCPKRFSLSVVIPSRPPGSSQTLRGAGVEHFQLRNQHAVPQATLMEIRGLVPRRQDAIDCGVPELFGKCIIGAA